MNWRYKIRLNEVIGRMNDQFDLSRVEEVCPIEVKEAFALEVEKAWPLKGFAAEFRKAKSIAAVNRVLERVFDTADANAVWCGMPS